MAKRSWYEANASLSPEMGTPGPLPVTSRRRGYDLPPPSTSGTATVGPSSSSVGLTTSTTRRTSQVSSSYALTVDTPAPGLHQQQQASLNQVEISRKVKACAACRKQKIRCHMENGKPPCTRCKQRNLSCVLNKSLQMLMDERSQWHMDIVSDLELLHSGLQELRGQNSLPPLPNLRSSEDHGRPDPNREPGPSEDHHEETNFSPGATSPIMGFTDEGTHHQMQQPGFFPSIPPPPPPLHPRGPALSTHNDSGGDESPGSGGGGDLILRDFIAAGQISVADAQRLFDLYISRLDFFVFQIGGRWRTLDALRSRSAILTASIMTVAALHDPGSNHIYPVCNREFRRLISASVFDRRVDRDHLRALCVASYWLSDMSWTLSGMAIRRATEVNLSGNYHRVLSEHSEDAADCLRLWFHLYNCDKHLSILYSRAPLVREDLVIQGCEEFLKTPVATDHDKRLVTQVSLHLILTGVHELFGPDNGAPIPPAYSTQIAHFSRQLDRWAGVWSTALKNTTSLGEYPAKGALIFYHYAKLYLFSHIFRGLANEAIPVAFQDAAAGAIGAATSIIELVLTDPDVGDALRGMPSYLHAMTCFACVFLLKLAAKRQDDLVEVAVVGDLASKLVAQLRSVRVSKFHLAPLMADGLEKSASSLLQSSGGPGGMSSSLGGGGEGQEDASRMLFGIYPDPMGGSNVRPAEAPARSSVSSNQSQNVVLGAQSLFDFGTEQSGAGSDDQFGFT